jgi:hypothetical protein
MPAPELKTVVANADMAFILLLDDVGKALTVFLRITLHILKRSAHPITRVSSSIHSSEHLNSSSLKFGL